jgi:oligopeptide/dipeptide ABC transporter ATP-binding protein
MLPPTDAPIMGRRMMSSHKAVGVADGVKTGEPSAPLLEVSDLRVHFHVEDHLVRAVDGVSYCIEAGKTLGVVGESGCGKTVSALAIMGLIEDPPGRLAGGEILYRQAGRGIDLTAEPRNGHVMRSIRGRKIAMIFQEPTASLNPVYSIGHQVAEAIRLHRQVGSRRAKRQAIESLRAVGIPTPEHFGKAYPHQLSGGMRQRVLIAIALAGSPSLLIADEPTTALDGTVQAQILDLIDDTRAASGMAIEFITHDLAVIANVADEVVVMYFGTVVETAPIEEIFRKALHPYTRGLIASIPSFASPDAELRPIAGAPPDRLQEFAGCAFEPRCMRAMEICKAKRPECSSVTSGHAVACWLVGRKA